MKVVKSQIVLYIYNLLLCEKELNADEICSLFRISKRTYFSYISEIKAFLCNFYPEKELYYDFKRKKYFINNHNYEEFSHLAKL